MKTIKVKQQRHGTPEKTHLNRVRGETTKRKRMEAFQDACDAWEAVPSKVQEWREFNHDVYDELSACDDGKAEYYIGRPTCEGSDDEQEDAGDSDF